jgi:glycosyltransferase involved in cell wall biosynthesis
VRVALFHTLSSEGRVSMGVYARELGDAIERTASGRVVLEHRFPAIPSWQQQLAKVRLVGRAAGYLSRYYTYQRQVRRPSADVSHIVDHGYGHLAFSLDPRRTVVTFHDAVLLRLQAGELRVPGSTVPWLTVIGHQLSLRAMRHVAHVIADSESSKRDLLRFTGFDPARVSVIPLGVSSHFRQSPDGGERSQTDLTASPQRRTKILHVGHCGVYKNVEGIIGAVPVLEKLLGGPVELIKVGGAFTDLQKGMIAQLGIGDRIRHLGAVPLADLPGVYRDADVLVMPSHYEGFGLPVLEAMACGTPVVASNRASLPEVVGDAGVLVDSPDAPSIAAAVAGIITTPGRREELRAKGLERARSFSWDATARATIGVYERVLGGAR